jgi:hypothetical protein
LAAALRSALTPASPGPSPALILRIGIYRELGRPLLPEVSWHRKAPQTGRAKSQIKLSNYRGKRCHNAGGVHATNPVERLFKKPELISRSLFKIALSSSPREHRIGQHAHLSEIKGERHWPPIELPTPGVSSNIGRRAILRDGEGSGGCPNCGAEPTSSLPRPFRITERPDRPWRVSVISLRAVLSAPASFRSGPSRP